MTRKVLIVGLFVFYDVDEFLLGVDTHFLVDVVRVCFDGSLGNIELVGDVFRIAPFCKKEKDLAFAWR